MARAGTAMPLASRTLEHAQRDRGVGALMGAGETDGHAVRNRSRWRANRAVRPRLARDAVDRRTPPPARSGPTTTGTPGLMMPAFSIAISRSVVPRYSW